MYKCKECGAEYEEKPDYCDCGNDEFEGENISVNENIKETADNINSSAKQTDSAKPASSYQNTSDKKIIEDQPKVQSASSMNFNNNYKQHSYIPQRITSIDPISLIIFVSCILLSLYVIFFAWNDNGTENVENNTETKTITNTKNIPTIDTIWNNAVPIVKTEKPKREEIVENITNQNISTQTQNKIETPKTITNTTKPKVVNTVPKKTTQTSQTKTTKTTITKQQADKNAQEQARIAAEAAAKQKAEQERKAAEAAQLKKLQAEQAKKAAEEKARQEAAAKQEYATYKANLRNTIGRKIDFTRVIGDGSCTVAFKIDPNGKLIKRSFAKQSSNNTLNDAVYAAVMATPSYNPPPSAYNNETLNLNIKFSNGNFEISLP